MAQRRFHPKRDVTQTNPENPVNPVGEFFKKIDCDANYYLASGAGRAQSFPVRSVANLMNATAVAAFRTQKK
jgi:hypothetical protein